MTRVPGFLIIGAMKAGTTTLFEDLSSHPRVFGPIDKEPDILISDQYTKQWAMERYASLFARATKGQLCFEASTGYTKTPQRPAVAERAAEVCGDDLKIIYIVRDPVRRIISHHHHASFARAAGLMAEPLEEALELYPELKDWCRYMMQLRPWVDRFGEDNVAVVPFERYTKDRRGAAELLQRFLGLEPKPELINTERVANKSSGKVTHSQLTRKLSKGAVYRSVLRPLVPEKLRESVFRALGRKTDRAQASLDESTAEGIRAELQPEYDEAVRRYSIYDKSLPPQTRAGAGQAIGRAG